MTPSDATIQAEFSVQGLTIEGNVSAIQKGSLVISIIQHRELLSPNYLIEQIKFKTDDGIVLIRQGRIIQITATAEETQINIRTNDVTSQAALWSLAYKQAHSYDSLSPVITEEPAIPHRGHYSSAKWQERLDWLRQQTQQPLPHLGNTLLKPENLKGNIENFVGGVQIPVGVAGPLFVQGQYAKGYYLAPLATTEGALVASASRGAKALNKSGGVRTHVIRQQMMRAPVFVTASYQHARQLLSWIMDHREEMDEQVAATSRHAKIVSIEPFLLGRTLHIRFSYQTGDAAGQNMTTACTWKVCQWIMAQMQYYPQICIENFYIESNTSGDKKVNYYNFSSGRGIRVMAEAILSDEVLRQILKVEAEELLQVTQYFMEGSVQLGMLGFNINIANIIAAIFTATGQDIACVHESAVGQLSIQKHPQGIYASLLLPSLIIGTVGGGTGLPVQQECLQMMDCAGAGQVNKLAEIIAGFCLALDLSTLSAIASGQFASAHERLGRNRPEDGLKEEHLTQAFFEEILIREEKQPVQVTAIHPQPFDTGNSILSDLTANQLKKKVGHFLYEVHYMKENQAQQVKLLIKAKSTDHEVVNMLNQMAQACGNPLASLYELHKFDTGFKNCHRRELEMYRIQDKRFTTITPRIYNIWEADEQEIYLLVMEHLNQVTHLNTVNNIGQWKEEHIKIALQDIAAFHSIFLGQEEQLREKKWLHRPNGATAQKLMPLWKALLAHHAHEFPKLYTPQQVKLIEKAIDAIPKAWIALEKSPQTIIHNDFNLRNSCMRHTSKGLRLCVYDWELASVHVPQYDVCEFLAFVLPPEAPLQLRHFYLDFYRTALENHSGIQFDAASFLDTFNWACLDFAYNRLSLYAMAHTFKHYEFLPRVLASHLNYVATYL